MIPVTLVEYVDLSDLPEDEFIPLKDLVKIIEVRMREQQIESWEHRPWGKYKVISEGPNFTIKHLVVNPGGKTSIQSHTGREEFWTVASGVATVVYGNTMEDISSIRKPLGSTFHVKQGQIHRLQNDEDTNLHVIEIWKGDVLSEDDIIRYQDSYGRV